MNFSVYLQLIIEQDFMYHQANFVMARKACFGNFHEKATETLIGHNVGRKDCGCLSNFFFRFRRCINIL